MGKAAEFQHGGDAEVHWYALRVIPQKEFTVAYLLRKQGIRTFLPTETRFNKRNRFAKQKVEFAFPAFPGCLFAGFAAPPDWWRVRKNTMIVGPVGAGGHPWRLDMVELLKFMGGLLDGCLVIDDGQRLVQVQGRSGLLRSPVEHSRTIARRERPVKGSSGVQVPRRKERLLERFVLPEPAALMRAAE